MSRTNEVLRQYRNGKEPGRIARDLKMPRDEVWAILEGKRTWERLGVGEGSTADQVLAALRRHEGDFEFLEAEPEIELLVELADRLDAERGWSADRRQHLLFSLEHVLNGLADGYGAASNPLVAIHFRKTLKSLGSLDESEWPAWLRREAVAA